MTKNSSTKILLDSGNSQETKTAKNLLGFLDGQTTNPSLISKNPEIDAYLKTGKKLTQIEALDSYRKIIEQIAEVTTGPVSIQVIAGKTTVKEDMLRQAKIYHDWIENAVIKFPITYPGLAAAEEFCIWGPVNLTLNFSQSQAAAVYQATKNAKFAVFVSPFVGRLDDIGQNGMEVAANILKMFKNGDGHVKTIVSSIRKIEHLWYSLFLKSPYLTAPLTILKNWSYIDWQIPGDDFKYKTNGLAPISYQDLILNKDWRDYNISHQLTDRGLDKFMLDWKSITK